MPKLIRDTSNVNYEEGLRKPYGGPMPPQGVYPGEIVSCELRTNKEKTGQYFNLLVALETKGVEGKEQYDGYPAWVMLALTNKEANLNREQAFYAAIGAGTKPEILYDDKGQVTKIGGKKPVGAKVKVFLKHELYEGVTSAKGDTIYPFGDGAPAAAKKPVADIEDAPDDEEVEVEEAETQEVDLDAMTLPQLRELAKSLGIATGRKKPDTLRDEITDALADQVTEEEEAEAEAEAAEAITQEEVEKMNIIKLKKFAVESGFEADDLKGMTKDEIIEVLVDEGLVTPF